MANFESINQLICINNEQTHKSNKNNPEEDIKQYKAITKAKYLNELQNDLIEQIQSLTDEELKEKISTYFILDRKIARYMVTKYILRKYHIMTDILTDEIKAYSQETKYFEKIGTEKIKSYITEEFKFDNTKKDSEEILHLLKTMTYISNEDIKKARTNDYIPLINGIFDISEMKLIAHDPKYLFDYQIPVKFDINAKCELFENFLNQVINEKDKTLIYDIFGLTLYPINILEKFFVLTGSGSNGKSVFINVLEEFIGHNNRSAISLKQMQDDKFSVARMYKKLLNVGADISGDIIRDTSLLKSASAKDSISGQFKFGQIFEFTPSATLVYSANTPPLFKDDSDGMNRRPELISFPNKFGNDEDIKENPLIKKADPNILKKLIQPEELSGILNFAIKHLIDIINNGQLSVVRSINQSKMLYKKYSNSAVAYIEEFCEECPYIPSDKVNNETIPASGFILVSDIFPKYKKWCIENELSYKERGSFTKSLNYFDDWNIETGQKDYDEYNQRVRSIRGICWKNL